MVEPPFAFAALDHVVLRVSDLPRMLAFYRDVLGCGLEKKQEAIGLWQLRAGDALIDLLESSDAASDAVDARRRNMDHFCLRLQHWDEQALRSWLQGRGVSVGPAVTRYGACGSGPSIYIEDPEGNTVELKAP
ncbi:MAG: VOC family protein [Ottowia sp.]|nr:VOC family protein [Ottowia sp.]